MDTLADESVVVIGGGIGGLSTACYLANTGADVRVIEKNEQVGGRASRLEKDGFRFDMGPSWYLMPDVFERFFGDFGRTPDDYYELTHLDPHYRIYFKDNAERRSANDTRGYRSGDPASTETTKLSRGLGTHGDRVDVTPDLERTKAVFEEYEPGAGEALERYLEKSRENYEVGMKHFVYEDRERLRDYLDLDVARQARGLSLLGSMQGHVEDYFDHPKLQQIMQYTLVFLGGSPTNTPALYNLMSHVDFNLGVWYPEGGIGAVIDSIAALGRELGVEYDTERPATEIKGRAGGFEVETAGGLVQADLVVSNADYAHTERDLLTPERRGYDADYWDERTYAPSAFLLYLGVEGDVDDLAHHTLVLPTDWNDHFAKIFDEPQWPDDPAYYVCTPSETDDAVAPDGHSALFVLVPIAPGLKDTPGIRDRYRDLVLADLAANAGTDVRDRIVLEERFCVEDFANRYNSSEGTALGLAHTLRQTSLFRPPHRSKTVDGLYFVGGDTTPGIGMPMCLISGRLTAEKVLEDHG